MLVKHIRDDLRRPFATIVAIENDGEILLGTSFCSPKDNFKKSRGTEIAFGRAKTGSIQVAPSGLKLHNGWLDAIVLIIADEEDNMRERAKKYFKV